MTGILAVIPWAVIVLSSLSLGAVVLLQWWPDGALSRILSRVAYRRPSDLSELNRREWLNRLEFAQLEKDLPGLQTVLFLGEKVERPTPALAHAVLDNFSEGVKYAFFVSNSDNDEADLISYREWFRHLFDVANQLGNAAGAGRCFEDVLSIKRLPGSWVYVPYVFYIFNEDGRERILALKGSEVGVGLARKYMVVREAEARTIMSLVSMSSKDVVSEFDTPDETVISVIPKGSTRRLELVTDEAEAA